MSTVAEINQRIAVANAESKRINNERNINLGKKQTLETQLQQALAKYKADFGVELTLENLQEETNKALAEKEAELTKIEKMLTLIQNGNYDEAQALAVPTTEEVVVKDQNGEVSSTFEVPVENVLTEKQVEEIKNRTVAPTMEEIKAMTAQNVAKAEEVVAPPVTQSVAPPVTQPVAPPVAPPPTSTPIVKPTQEVKPVTDVVKDEGAKPNLNLSGIDALADFVAPPPTVTNVATPPVKKTVEEKKNETVTPDLTSFAAILGGTAFTPN